MKKQYSVSITDGSGVAAFLDGLGHKRGLVIEAILSQHLRENKGYLSPEAAIEAGYRFTEKDTDFARWFVGAADTNGDSGEGVSAKEKKTKSGRKRERMKKGIPRNPGDGKSIPKEQEKAQKTMPEETPTGGMPEVKNKDMVLAGLAAFMG